MMKIKQVTDQPEKTDEGAKLHQTKCAIDYFP